MQIYQPLPGSGEQQRLLQAIGCAHAVRYRHRAIPPAKVSPYTGKLGGPGLRDQFHLVPLDGGSQAHPAHKLLWGLPERR